MVATLVLETSVFDVWVRLPPFPPSNKTMNTKSTVKSCSCRTCRICKGTVRGNSYMLLEERAARHGAKIALNQLGELFEDVKKMFHRSRVG